MVLFNQPTNLQKRENRLQNVAGMYPVGYCLVIILAILLFFSGLGSAPVYILDEAKNAQCAREMLRAHNWVVPVFNGQLRTDKPVFHYWMMMFSYSLFGVSPLSARFFSGIAGILLIAYTYRFAKIVYNAQTAFWACVILLSSLHLSLEMHFAVPDPYFIFFVAASMFEYYFYYTFGRGKHLVLCYVFVALGVLSKGPSAILLTGATMLCHLLLVKNFTLKGIRQLRPFIGIAIILLLAGPWYYWVHILTNGLWTRGFFLDHNFNRFTTIKEGHGGFFLLTLVFVAVGLLPFAVWLLPALVNVVRKKQYSANDLFLLAAAGFIVVFFTISQTKLPNYTIPAYPFLALLLARHWLAQKPRNEMVQWVIYMMLMLLLPAAAYVAVVIEPAIKNLAPVALLLLALPAGAVIGWLLYKRGNVWGSRLAVATSFWVTILLFNTVVYPAIYNSNAVRKSLAVMGSKQQFAAFQSYNPGYNFYLPGNIPVLQDSVSLTKYLQQNRRAYILTREENLYMMGKQPLVKIFAEKDIFETAVTVVMGPLAAGNIKP